MIVNNGIKYLSKMLDYDGRDVPNAGNSEHDMGVSHDFFVGRDDKDPVEKYLIEMRRPTPAVWLGNTGDSYYIQYFHNWSELNAFIENLKKTGVEAWGEPIKQSDNK